MNFLKNILSTVIGIFVFFIICFILLIGIGIALGGSSSDSIKLNKNSVLELNVNYKLLDNAGEIYFKDFPFLDQKNKNGLYDLVAAINHAATDDKIKGISITNLSNQAGLTQLKTLREALENFKKSGKFIKAYNNVYSQSDYYLSSVADSIYLNPIGGVDFKGLSSQLLYFKDFEEKSGIKFEVFRVGKYKSAVEPFLENEMSEANREQISSFLNSLWSNIRKEVGLSRNISDSQLDTIAENLLTRNAQLALENGFVDKLAYYDEFEKSLKADLNLDEKDKLNQISITEYTKLVDKQKTGKKPKDKIAIVYAQGEIRDNDGSVKRIAPDQMNRALKKVREDKSIKAVVLRVNSPGGSAFASELIWRELELTKKEKPVIVSMGDLAASGGYYIAAGGDRIFAEPTTLTGSIGVFGILPNLKNLGNRVGVNAQEVSTHSNTIDYNPFNHISENQKFFINEAVQDIYKTFKTRVSEGRNLNMEEVEEIAQGRVWTGEQALKNGLVDELGSLEDALKYAAAQADIQDYQLASYPKFKINPAEIMERYGLEVKMDKEKLIEEILGEDLFPLYETLQTVQFKENELLLPYRINLN